MTVIVFDPALNACFADRCFQIHGSMRVAEYEGTKVRRTRDGHQFASSGDGSEHLLGAQIDSAVMTLKQGVVTKIDYQTAAECNVVVRTVEGEVLLSTGHPDGSIVLYPAHDWHLGIPWARGSGGVAFDLFYQEHRDTHTALNLVVKHAHACGFGVDRF